MAKTKTYTKSQLKKTMEEMGYSIQDPIVESNPGDFRVHQISTGLYLETINLSSSGIVRFNGKKYSDLKIMMLDLIKCAYSKEFPPETYNPDYRSEWVSTARRCAVIENAGFQRNGIVYGGQHKFISRGELGVVFGMCSEDCLYIGDYSLVNFYDPNDETLTDSDKCNSIKSILTAFNAANLAILANNIVKSGRVDALKELKIKTIDPTSLQMTENDALPAIIGILENTIKNLKGEE